MMFLENGLDAIIRSIYERLEAVDRYIDRAPSMVAQGYTTWKHVSQMCITRARLTEELFMFRDMAPLVRAIDNAEAYVCGTD